MYSLNLVIDADIAKSAGVSEHPVSSASRNLLSSILNSENKHVLILCKNLKSEWSKHKSTYTTKWLATMTARKKVFIIKEETAVYLTQLIEASKNISEREKEVAIKDAHLVELALANNAMIFSNDDKARKVFCDLADDIGRLKELKWFNVVFDINLIFKVIDKNTHISEEYFLSKTSTETQYLLSIPSMSDSIKKGMAEPLSESIKMAELDW